MNGVLLGILWVNWCYNINLLLRLRYSGSVQYNLTTKLFYVLSGAVIVARFLFLLWLYPPYGDQKTILSKNIADYSLMGLGILQISNLAEINMRLKTLNKDTTNLDRSAVTKSLKQNS